MANCRVQVGPKCTELKVKKPEEFAFNPRQLLCDIVDVYLHLSADKKHPEFVAAVGRDGRSYDRKHFEKAASILVSKGVKSERDVQKLLDFVERIEESLREDKKQEEAMGEAPDEVTAA